MTLKSSCKFYYQLCKMAIVIQPVCSMFWEGHTSLSKETGDAGKSDIGGKINARVVNRTGYPNDPIK